MPNSFAVQNSDKYRKELRRVSNIQAKEFLFRYGYSSSSFEVPEYYGAANLENIKLANIRWSKKERPLITTPLNFLTPKGFLSWRNFSLLHPYIFIHLVSEITQKANWEAIKALLAKKTLVSCYSLPDFAANTSSDARKASITRWVQMAENDLIKDGIHYPFLAVTDIKNFYPSVYTHSISWAIHGKEIAKDNRFDYSLLGNKLDKLFQNSRDGQTNGIPVGSMVSDIAAEIILKDIDNEFSKWIRSCSLEDKVLVSRYRDDFRILTKTEEIAKRSLKELSKILDRTYNLSLNSEKTRIFNDVIEGAFRDWANEIKEDFLLREAKYGTLPKEVTAPLLKDLLLKTYKVQKSYPDGRSSVTLLSKLIEHFDSAEVILNIEKSDIHTIISFLRKLSLLREEVSAQVYILLDILLEKLDFDTAEAVIDDLLSVISEEGDYDYQVIWLYRLCLARAPEKCKQILTASKGSALITLLSEDYRNKFLYDYEIFGEVKGLSAPDKKSLQAFTFVNDAILADSVAMRIDRDLILLFEY